MIKSVTRSIVPLIGLSLLAAVPVAGYYSPKLVPKVFRGKSCQYVLYQFSNDSDQSTAYVLPSDIELLPRGPDGEITGTFPGPDDPSRTMFRANLKLRNPFNPISGRSRRMVCDFRSLKQDQQTVRGFPKNILPISILGASIKLDRLYGVEVTSASPSHAKSLYPGSLRAKFLLSEKDSTTIAAGAGKRPTRIEVRYEVRIDRASGISIQMIDPIVVEATI